MGVAELAAVASATLNAPDEIFLFPYRDITLNLPFAEAETLR
nr:hypothetical protein [Methylocella tundrae]